MGTRGELCREDARGYRNILGDMGRSSAIREHTRIRGRQGLGAQLIPNLWEFVETPKLRADSGNLTVPPGFHQFGVCISYANCPSFVH